MNIIVNGTNTEVDNDLTAAQLVRHLDLIGKRLAMEVNLEIVPRSEYESFKFKPEDCIEVVQAIGGG